MRAIVQDTYGSADVLRLAEINKPDIAASRGGENDVAFLFIAFLADVAIEDDGRRLRRRPSDPTCRPGGPPELRSFGPVDAARR